MLVVAPALARNTIFEYREYCEGKPLKRCLRALKFSIWERSLRPPLAGVMLADLGAEVIKVERPEGDPFRYARGGQYSPNFLAYNRGKRSIVLDLNVAADRDDLLDLVEQSDVLIENFRPRTLAKLGIVPEVLRARNARLIHCSITGFGVSGPYRERACL